MLSPRSHRLGAETWGLGVATEAAGALIDHAFGGLLDGLERIESGYWSENVGSAKVQSKLGFSLLGRGPLLCLARGCERDPFHLGDPLIVVLGEVLLLRSGGALAALKLRSNAISLKPREARAWDHRRNGSPESPA